MVLYVALHTNPDTRKQARKTQLEKMVQEADGARHQTLHLRFQALNTNPETRKQVRETQLEKMVQEADGAAEALEAQTRKAEASAAQFVSTKSQSSNVSSPTN